MTDQEIVLHIEGWGGRLLEVETSGGVIKHARLTIRHANGKTMKYSGIGKDRQEALSVAAMKFPPG